MTQAAERLTCMLEVPSSSLVQGTGYLRCVHSSSHANVGIVCQLGHSTYRVIHRLSYHSTLQYTYFICYAAADGNYKKFQFSYICMLI